MENKKLYRILTAEAAMHMRIPALYLAGEPGAGKTWMAEEFVQYWGAQAEFCQCHQGFGEEKLVYDFHPGILVDAVAGGASKALDALRMGYLTKAFKRSHDGRIVLIIDELDKSLWGTDEFFLDAINSGRFTDPMLGEITAKKGNLVVIFTSNEKREIDNALIDRCRCMRVLFPEKEELMRRLKAMEPIGYAALGQNRFSSLIDIMYKFRALGPRKYVSPRGVARMMFDLQFAESKDDVLEVVRMNLSPYTEDHLLLDKIAGGGSAYVAGQLFKAT